MGIVLRKAVSYIIICDRQSKGHECESGGFTACKYIMMFSNTTKSLCKKIWIFSLRISIPFSTTC